MTEHPENALLNPRAVTFALQHGREFCISFQFRHTSDVCRTHHQHVLEAAEGEPEQFLVRGMQLTVGWEEGRKRGRRGEDEGWEGWREGGRKEGGRKEGERERGGIENLNVCTFSSC